MIHTGGRGTQAIEIDMLPKTQVELVIKNDDTDSICNIIMEAAQTGSIGDGKMFVSPISAVYIVRAPASPTRRPSKLHNSLLE